MFCSWANSPVHLGGPGLGGYGSDIYVMRRSWLQQLQQLAAESGMDIRAPAFSP